MHGPRCGKENICGRHTCTQIRTDPAVRTLYPILRDKVVPRSERSTPRPLFCHCLFHSCCPRVYLSQRLSSVSPKTVGDTPLKARTCSSPRSCVEVSHRPPHGEMAVWVWHVLGDGNKKQNLPVGKIGVPEGHLWWTAWLTHLHHMSE
jgi:hypothetical protein